MVEDSLNFTHFGEQGLSGGTSECSSKRRLNEEKLLKSWGRILFLLPWAAGVIGAGSSSEVSPLLPGQGS